MLLFKRKKSSALSSDLKRYRELLKEYGRDPAFVTAFGVKIFPTGEQFVKDARNGNVIIRDKNTQYLGRDEDSGRHFYLPAGIILKKTEEAHSSFVKEEETV